jgi:hypothetical protein
MEQGRSSIHELPILHFPHSENCAVKKAALHRQAAASIYMANTTPIPPLAKSAPPPPPLIVLLRDSDFILNSLPTLLLYEDLPLKHTTHSQSNHASACFHPYEREQFVIVYWMIIC